MRVRVALLRLQLELVQTCVMWFCFFFFQKNILYQSGTNGRSRSLHSMHFDTSFPITSDSRISHQTQEFHSTSVLAKRPTVMALFHLAWCEMCFSNCSQYEIMFRLFAWQFCCENCPIPGKYFHLNSSFSQGSFLPVRRNSLHHDGEQTAVRLRSVHQQIVGRKCS